MLKIEKNKDHLHVVVRDKDKRFNRFFFVALIFALSIHLMAALLFHVNLFSFNALENILPSSYVSAPLIKSSLDETDAIVSSLILKQGRVTADHLEPPSFLPTVDFQDYQEVSLFSFKKFKQESLKVLTTTDIEDLNFDQIHIPITTSPMRLYLSGLPQEVSWHYGAEFSYLYEKKSFSHENLKQTFLSYDVRIDGKTGKIFWMDLMNAKNDKDELVHLSKKILLDLQFNELQDTIYSGKVELIYSEEA